MKMKIAFGINLIFGIRHFRLVTVPPKSKHLCKSFVKAALPMFFMVQKSLKSTYRRIYSLEYSTLGSTLLNFNYKRGSK